MYTRVVDNNTPIDKQADLNDVEFLWRKRFGLLESPLDRIMMYLKILIYGIVLPIIITPKSYIIDFHLNSQ